jgi:hypothetical protein
MLAARALIEFLVGRPTGRHRGDIWPSDFHPTWHVKEGDTKLLRERLAYIDPWLAHLSLKRAGTAPPWPERWHDTVLRVLRLTRRFADEISEHPAYHRLCVPIDNVEALLR